VVVDRYVEFETTMLSAAPQVRNIVDQAFASDLAASAEPAATPDSKRLDGGVAPGSQHVDDAPPVDLEESPPAEPSSRLAIADQTVEASASCQSESKCEKCCVPIQEPAAATVATYQEQTDSVEVDAVDDVSTDVDGDPQSQAEAAEEDYEELLVATSIAAASPPDGEMLTIEEDDAPAASVVSGRQFRRLFSSLETGESLPHIGMR
ncbi:MAG: hypothetical protein AAF961_04980, partial [Planctomycetota bacterium]